jgi:ubiquitin-conjugating enzyme E2 W
LNVASVCITLQSMLASAKEKALPEGNDSYVKRAP